MKITSTLVALIWIIAASLYAPSPAEAAFKNTNYLNIPKHCTKFDPLTDASQIEGRRQWAYKCKYISEVQVENLRNENLYPGFFGFVAPTSPQVACKSYPKNSLVRCKVSCFAAETSLFFEQRPKHLTELTHLKAMPRTVTTMAEEATLTNLLISEQTFAPIMKSHYRGILVQIDLAGGQTIQVTDDHPMVDSSGTIVEAQNLVAETSLLTLTGPKKILSVQSINFDGELWNVAPNSSLAKGNVIVANGIFSGGLGYFSKQSDVYRIRLREELANKFLAANTK